MAASPANLHLVLDRVTWSGTPKLHEHVTVQTEARRPVCGRTIAVAVQELMRAMPSLGPYVVLATVLPGGILVATLLYLYRRRSICIAAANPQGCHSHNPVRSRIERYMRSIVLRHHDP